VDSASRGINSIGIRPGLRCEEKPFLPGVQPRPERGQESAGWGFKPQNYSVSVRRLRAAPSITLHPLMPNPIAYLSVSEIPARLWRRVAMDPLGLTLRRHRPFRYRLGGHRAPATVFSYKHPPAPRWGNRLWSQPGSYISLMDSPQFRAGRSPAGRPQARGACSRIATGGAVSVPIASGQARFAQHRVQTRAGDPGRVRLQGLPRHTGYAGGSGLRLRRPQRLEKRRTACGVSFGQVARSSLPWGRYCSGLYITKAIEVYLTDRIWGGPPRSSGNHRRICPTPLPGKGPQVPSTRLPVFYAIFPAGMLPAFNSNCHAKS